MDDLNSFFLVALWASLHNYQVDSSQLSPKELSFRKDFSGNASERLGMINQIGSPKLEVNLPTFSPILRSMWYIFKEWTGALDMLTAHWITSRTESLKADPTGGGLLQRFDFYAYQGVLDFLHIVQGHRKRLSEGTGENMIMVDSGTGFPIANDSLKL